jgi:hypothetical protein
LGKYKPQSSTPDAPTQQCALLRLQLLLLHLVLLLLQQLWLLLLCAAAWRHR